MAKVLLVEDEPEMLEVMRTALTAASHEVVALASGSCVIEANKGIDSDVAVTDIIMPDVEGIEILIHLKGLNPGMKLIAISGGGVFDASFHLEMASRLGAVQTLEKPFDVDTLVEVVQQALEPGRTIGRAGALDS